MPRRRPNSALPPPRTQAAAKSEPVFSAQRSRYASIVVSGSFRCSRWSASPRASASEATASAPTCSWERRGRERGERRGEEMVAGRLRGVGAVRRPGGRAASAQAGAVHDVVVDERGHVNELDRRALHDRRLRAGGAREERQGRPEALPTRGERVGAHRGDDARVGLHDLREARLDRVEVLGEPIRGADGLEGAHVRTPTWSATIVPPRSRKRTRSSPLRSRSATSCSASGNRRTLAGRYVYALPPGSTLPSSGTTRSNQSEKKGRRIPRG